MTPEPETVEGWSDAHDNTVRGNLRNGVKVARTELLRSYRQFVDDRRSLIVFGVALVVLLPVIYGSLSAVHDLGSDIAAQSQDVAGSRGEGTGITRPGGFGTGLGLTPGRLSLFDILKQQTTLLVFFLAGLFTLRTVERLAEVDNKDLLLTNTPTRSIVVGVVSAEILRNLSFFGVVLAVYSTAFALGLGTPSTALTVVLGFVPLLGFTVLVGFTLGLVLKFVVVKVPGATYLRYVAVVGLALGFYLTGGFRGFRLTSPLNSYADILFVTSPIGVSVGATELGVLVAILASFAGIGQLAFTQA
ncbi:MAG: hypothetical protein SV760_05305, partial [Halobacteria archaeon]|nr:hypothetical protein [Halobacteria archaeon]